MRALIPFKCKLEWQNDTYREGESHRRECSNLLSIHWVTLTIKKSSKFNNRTELLTYDCPCLTLQMPTKGVVEHKLVKTFLIGSIIQEGTMIRVVPESTITYKGEKIEKRLAGDRKFHTPSQLRS